MYPDTEKYRWIIFSDYRVRSVVETACDLGIDVWYWDMIENCWKRLFKCYDNDAQIIEENREEFKKFGINWKANYHWTYLKEYLIPWSEEDIKRMCEI